MQALACEQINFEFIRNLPEKIKAFQVWYHIHTQSKTTKQLLSIVYYSLLRAAFSTKARGGNVCSCATATKSENKSHCSL